MEKRSKIDQQLDEMFSSATQKIFVKHLIREEMARRRNRIIGITAIATSVIIAILCMFIQYILSPTC